MEAASRLLAGPHAAGAAEHSVAPDLFRHAIESSLLPVFAVLLGLAAVNLFLSSGFPETTVSRAEVSKPGDALV
jgi:hypothetical protein